MPLIIPSRLCRRQIVPRRLRRRRLYKHAPRDDPLSAERATVDMQHRQVSSACNDRSCDCYQLDGCHCRTCDGNADLAYATSCAALDPARAAPRARRCDRNAAHFPHVDPVNRRHRCILDYIPASSRLRQQVHYGTQAGTSYTCFIESPDAVQHARMTSRLDWVGQRQSISALTLLVVPLLHKQIFAPPSYERIHLARAYLSSPAGILA